MWICYPASYPESYPEAGRRSAILDSDSGSSLLFLQNSDIHAQTTLELSSSRKEVQQLEKKSMRCHRINCKETNGWKNWKKGNCVFFSCLWLWFFVSRITFIRRKDTRQFFIRCLLFRCLCSPSVVSSKIKIHCLCFSRLSHHQRLTRDRNCLLCLVFHSKAKNSTDFESPWISL